MGVQVGYEWVRVAQGACHPTTCLDHIHFEAWKSFLPKVMPEFTERYVEEHFNEMISGRLNPDVFLRLRPDMPYAEAYELGVQKEALWREMAADSLEPLPGLIDFLEATKEAGIEHILVTNAPRYVVVL